MYKFNKRLLLFLLPVLLIPITNWILDPFDYFNHPYKVSFDRIHRTRVFNVADWTLSELSKINPKNKRKAQVLTIGDSRGQSLITHGFDQGWKNRIFEINGKTVYDLSSGGAQLAEMKSLLMQELPYCPKVKTILFVLAPDRLIERPHAENRVKSSALNAKFPTLTYLMNPNHLYTFYKAVNQKTGDQMNPDEKAAAMKKIGDDMVKKFGLGNKKDFEQYLKDFADLVNELRDKKLQVSVILPPYEPLYFTELQKNHSALYAYVLQRLKSLHVPIINLQNRADEFEYQDPVHGLYLGKHHLLTTLPEVFEGK